MEYLLINDKINEAIYRDSIHGNILLTMKFESYSIVRQYNYVWFVAQDGSMITLPTNNLIIEIK